MGLAKRIKDAAALRQYSSTLVLAATRSLIARKSLWIELAAQTEWRQLHASGRFSQEFTANYAYCWWGAFKGRRDEITEYLELGSWEGQSAVLAAWLFPTALITAVDWFANRNAEKNFDRNTAQFSNRLEKVKGTTWEALSGFKVAGRRFDVIYIDADHRFDAVLLDTILAWPMLRIGGYLIWDDYLWRRPEVGPLYTKPAIDAWLARRSRFVEVIFADYQVCVRKLAEDPEIRDMAYTNSVASSGV